MSESVDEWDNEAAGWDDEPATRAYAAAAFDTLSGSGASLDGARVLDFGCGTGLLTEHLVTAGAVVVAVDTSAGMLDVLRRKIEVRSWTSVEIEADLDRVSGPFDLVVCSSVCSFLDDYPAMAERLGSMLSPDGVFVQWDWEREAGDDSGHGLTRAQIRATLSDAGLAVEQVGTAFSVEFEDMVMAPLIGVGRRVST